MDDPDALSKLGVCLDEELNAPIDLLPPAWMKSCTVAPAPRKIGPDRPLRIGKEVPANNVPQTSPPRKNVKNTGKGKKNTTNANTTGDSFMKNTSESFF